MGRSQITQGVIIAFFAAIFGAIANGSWESISLQSLQYSYEQLPVPVNRLGYELSDDSNVLDNSSMSMFIRLVVYNDRDKRVNQLEISDPSSIISNISRCDSASCSSFYSPERDGHSFVLGSLDPNSQTFVYLRLNSLYGYSITPPVVVVADGEAVHGYFDVHFIFDPLGIKIFALNNTFVTVIFGAGLMAMLSYCASRLISWMFGLWRDRPKADA